MHTFSRRAALASLGTLVTTQLNAKPKRLTVTEYDALRYSKSTEPDLRLRLLVPASDVPVPFVLFAHGKGTAYDSTTFDLVFAAINAKGIAVASAQYQDSDSGVVAPVPMQQLWGALRFLRGEKLNYNLQGAKSGLMGSSAGSFLAAQAATQYDTTWLGSFGLHPTGSAKVRAACLVSGCVYDPDLTNFSPSAKTYLAAQLGCADIMMCAPTGLYLPQYHFDSLKPDCLVIAGDQDTDVPLAHSQNTVAAMNLAGMNASLIVNNGVGHGWVNGSLQSVAIADFFESKLL